MCYTNMYAMRIQEVSRIYVWVFGTANAGSFSGSPETDLRK